MRKEGRGQTFSLSLTPPRLPLPPSQAHRSARTPSSGTALTAAFAISVASCFSFTVPRVYVPHTYTHAHIPHNGPSLPLAQYLAKYAHAFRSSDTAFPSALLIWSSVSEFRACHASCSTAFLLAPSLW